MSILLKFQKTAHRNFKMSKLLWNFTVNFIEISAKFHQSFTWNFNQSFNWNFGTLALRGNIWTSYKNTNGRLCLQGLKPLQSKPTPFRIQPTNDYRKDILNSTKKGPKSGGRKSLSVQRNGAGKNVLIKKSILRCLKCLAEGSLSNLNCRRI